MRNILIVVVCTITAALSLSARAATVSLEANLDGLQEVPPNASPAFGLLDITLNDVTGDVSVTSGSYQDLLGNSLAVTINGFASPGFNAPILINLTLDQPGATSGSISGTGSLTTAAQINGMTAGNTYVNIRSNVVPTGEIRGQLIPVTPEPATLLAFASLGGLLLRRRRA